LVSILKVYINLTSTAITTVTTCSSLLLLKKKKIGNFYRD